MVLRVWKALHGGGVDFSSEAVLSVWYCLPWPLEEAGEAEPKKSTKPHFRLR